VEACCLCMIMITTMKTTLSKDDTVAQTMSNVGYSALLLLLDDPLYSVVLCTSPVKQQHLSSCIHVTLHAAMILAAYKDRVEKTFTVYTLCFIKMWCQTFLR